jgi:hypothetical protein
VRSEIFGLKFNVVGSGLGVQSCTTFLSGVMTIRNIDWERLFDESQVFHWLIDNRRVERSEAGFIRVEIMSAN